MSSTDLPTVLAIVFVWVTPIAAVATLLWNARSRGSEAPPPNQQ